MNQKPLSRRRFALAGAGLLAPSPPALAQPITAQSIVDRIQRALGIPWRQQTVDTFKAGGPDVQIHGIATTVMATLDVLQRAHAARRNLVITHEPTFYNHEDRTTDLESDPVYRHKQEFIKKSNMSVWRFHDHWHARQPDEVLVGLADLFGWTPHQMITSPRIFALPETTLEALAKDIQNRLKARTLRVIGDPQTKVSRVALSPGAAGLMTAVRLLPEADVFVAGEQREWEGVEYAQDAIAAGQKKGMILLGHAISEDPGMRLCAQWLRTFITDVPVEWIPAGEPFWRPG